MDWQEKFKALDALDGDVSIKMACDGTFFVSADIAVTDGHIASHGTEYAKNPIDAIEKFWEKRILTTIGNLYIICHGQCFQWNGFMWKHFPKN